MAKITTKKSNKKAREKRKSDEVYNARRRYRRQAERYLKQAEKTQGATSARYSALAKAQTEKALSTYAETSKPRGRLAEIASAFQIGYKRAGSLSGVIKESFAQLLNTKTTRREQMAKDLLATQSVGGRFFGGLSDIWTKDEDSRNAPIKPILEFFGAKDLMEVLEMLEEQGIDIYTPAENDDVYMSIQLKLQNYVADLKKNKNA